MVVTMIEDETVCLLAIPLMPLASARGARFALLGGSTTVVVVVVKVVTVAVFVVVDVLIAVLLEDLEH
jgi:hypothetical protein